MGIERTVLILQADYLYGFKLLNDVVNNVQIRAVVPGQMPDKSFLSWLGNIAAGEPRHVELILDTTLDEIDRVAVPQSGKRWIDRYRLWATLRRLRRDYVHSKVYALPQGYDDNVAGLMHIVFPDAWRDCLYSLQEQGVVFHRVYTGTEVVAEWSRRFISPTLLVMPVAGDQRHLLVDSGKPVFMRTLHVAKRTAGEVNSLIIVEQTIEYLKNHIPGLGENLKVTELAGCEMFNALTNGKHIDRDAGLHLSKDNPELHQLDNSASSFGAVSYLLAMLLDLPLDSRTNSWCLRKMQCLQSCDAPGSGVEQREATPSLKGKIYSFKLWIHSRWDSSAMSSDGLMLLYSAARSIEVFALSVVYLKKCRLRRRVLAMSIMFATLASGVVTTAIGNGISTTRLISKNDRERATLVRAMQGKFAAAVALNNSPAIAANALALAGQLTASVGMSAESLFESVGSALTAVPGITLDEMIWVPVSNNEVYESMAYAMNAIPHRQSFDVSHNGVVQQLELSGRVAGVSLQEQKAQLDLFEDALRHLPGALAVSIIESPVAMALSSGAGDSTAANYRISLQLGDI